MKYKFVTVLHNMKIDSRLNKGIEIQPGTRISNGKEVLSEILNTDLMRETAGFHSINEFNGTVYFYKYGEFADITTLDEMDQKGWLYNFAFLREAQGFVTDLWGVKDNGIYVRDGFLLAYEDNVENGHTYKSSLSAIFTHSSGKISDFEFSRDEIALAINSFDPFSLDEIDEDGQYPKYPVNDHFFKNSGYDRIHKAQYFTLDARGNTALPMKIVLYCTALECLFSTSKSEITHKISERVAVLLGTSTEERKELSKFIKKAYGYRSTIIHGSNLSGSEDRLVEVSTRLDNILRQLILGNHEVFSKTNEDIDDYFLDLLF
ncbi:HEPN domain-containing protein [Peribacillus simplex]|uniref:Apea-like HEPN domain-containing protein n=1 Tax=Peribacillus simplex TaxID=1478 RepID=A0AAN2TQH7_9BACI|nr:HEPN domain-containing protein [Peribacillus simplex]CEG30042.1 hypothetical protein BN1180_00137 [Peribacillus simplex]